MSHPFHTSQSQHLLSLFWWTRHGAPPRVNCWWALDELLLANLNKAAFFPLSRRNYWAVISEVGTKAKLELLSPGWFHEFLLQSESILQTVRTQGCVLGCTFPSHLLKEAPSLSSYPWWGKNAKRLDLHKGCSYFVQFSWSVRSYGCCRAGVQDLMGVAQDSTVINES